MSLLGIEPQHLQLNQLSLYTFIITIGVALALRHARVQLNCMTAALLKR